MSTCQALLMEWAKRVVWAGVLSLCWVSCAGAQKPVQSVAEYDLGCSKVEITRIEKDRYAAYGCGRGAMYVESCEGGECHWARMRHGHEDEIARQNQPASSAPAAPREILPAPTPEQREVLPAPAPQQREVLPAPPPGAASGAQGAPAASSGGEAAPQSGDAQLGSQVTPLSQGDLSDPYQATVPEQATAQQVAYAPPAPLVETRPPPPSVTYVWVSGYWWWATPGWTWVPGYWCPPRPGFVWIGSSWYWSSGWWWYYPGGWGYPGTHTVVYAPAPRPNRVVTVRTFHPHRTVRPAPAPSRLSEGRPAGMNPSRGVASSPALHPAYRPTQSPLVRYPATSHAASRQQSAFATRSDYPSSSSFARPQGAPGRLVQPHAPRPSYSTFSSPSRNYNSIMPRSSSVPTGSHVRPSSGGSRIQSSHSFSHGSPPSHISPHVTHPRR